MNNIFDASLATAVARVRTALDDFCKHADSYERMRQQGLAAMKDLDQAMNDAESASRGVEGEAKGETPVQATSALLEARRNVAEAAFEAYDFGEDVVAGADGWEYTVPGASMSRIVYIEADPADAVEGREDSPSVAVVFSVRFADDSSELLEASALLRATGAPIGRPSAMLARGEQQQRMR